MNRIISVIVPFCNEESTIVPLYEQLLRTLLSITQDFEIVFIDDGSSDGSAGRALELVRKDARVRLIRLQGNFGKSAALAAGFDQCRGQIIFTMDADLQDDPKEIPRFLAKLDQGYDVVSGYKKKRFDPWHKVWPSRIFNAMVRLMTGIGLHDVNCGFKCYRRQVIERIHVYGEMHRFLPVLAFWKRFRIGEIEVEHHPREFGVTKFGTSRMLKGLMDLLTISFLIRYSESPSYLFGKIGFASTIAGFFICLYLSILWVMGKGPIGNRPMLFLGILLIVVGIQFFGIGLLAEMLTFSLSKTEKPYIISKIDENGLK